MEERLQQINKGLLENNLDLELRVEKYKEEIIELRGKLHLSCPSCYEDCPSWIVDGQPCKNDW